MKIITEIISKNRTKALEKLGKRYQFAIKIKLILDVLRNCYYNSKWTEIAKILTRNKH